MVLVFCRGGEVAGRERGEGVIDQKRERERSTSQHENRLVPRLLKPHSHRVSMLSILTPYGIGGTNRFMGMDHVSPGQEILQRGETSIQGTGLIAVQYRQTITIKSYKISMADNNLDSNL